MQTIHEIRLTNVRGILLKYANGKQKILAEKLKLNPNTVSRWLGDNENRANISDDSARTIENLLGLEIGFMDNTHTQLDIKKVRKYFSDYASIAAASPKTVNPLIIFDAALARWEAEIVDPKTNPMDIFMNLQTDNSDH
ncbi:helix-turn-helix domain-containing protein [Aliikangiella coralliicola]|uniref:Uncharacterized protein n=1 Tax=Aliikangiella coralliicola TaxID=2592383 RepID=A0A545U075_9GAMM|nr:hypothetical protein [Aliikangiella coralliicola]TQV82833.1 hypothetical protein FLL46_23990 [Aliikangiella coralliicola]